MRSFRTLEKGRSESGMGKKILQPEKPRTCGLLAVVRHKTPNYVRSFFLGFAWRPQGTASQ